MKIRPRARRRVARFGSGLVGARLAPGCAPPRDCRGCGPRSRDRNWPPRGQIGGTSTRACRRRGRGLRRPRCQQGRGRPQRRATASMRGAGAGSPASPPPQPSRFPPTSGLRPVSRAPPRVRPRVQHHRLEARGQTPSSPTSRRTARRGLQRLRLLRCRRGRGRTASHVADAGRALPGWRSRSRLRPVSWALPIRQLPSISAASPGFAAAGTAAAAVSERSPERGGAVGVGRPNFSAN